MVEVSSQTTVCRQGSYTSIPLYKRVVAWVLADKLLTILLLAYIVLIVLVPGYSRRSVHYPDYRALETIASLIAGSILLEYSGVFQEAARRLTGYRTGRRAVVFFLLLVIISSLIVLNDAMIFIAIPLAIAVSARTGVDKGLLVPLAIAAVNIGSSMSPIGNPQNIIIWHHYDLTPVKFLEFTIPAYIIPVIVLLTISLHTSRTLNKRIEPGPPIYIDRKTAVLGAISITLTIIFSIIKQPIYALIISLAALATKPRLIKGYDIRVPASIWLAYAVLRGISTIIGLHPLPGYKAYLAAYLASQAISNVPATILLLNSPWKPLQLGVNLGGLPLPQSSIANLVGLRISNTTTKTYIKNTWKLSLALLMYGLIITLLITR